MVKIRASCSVAGNTFSPAMFAKQSAIKLLEAHEPGAIGGKGRYRGKPIPYGSGSIEVSNRAEEDWSRFDDLLALLERCIEALRKSGAEDLTLWCSLFHDGQCNFSLSQEQLIRIAALKLDLAISRYGSELE